MKCYNFEQDTSLKDLDVNQIAHDSALGQAVVANDVLASKANTNHVVIGKGYPD